MQQCTCSPCACCCVPLLQSNLYQYGEQRHVKEDERLPWFLIREHSASKLAWDILTLVVVLYSAVMTPIKIGFDTSTREFGNSRGLPVDRECGVGWRMLTDVAHVLMCAPAASWELGIEYLSDAIFIVDFVVNFLTANKQRGVYQTSIQQARASQFDAPATRHMCDVNSRSRNHSCCVCVAHPCACRLPHHTRAAGWWSTSWPPSLSTTSRTR